MGLTGLTTPDSGGFNVSLDSRDPVNLSGRASFTSSEPTLLFFRTGLDPSVMHTIEVINAGPTGAGDGAGSLLVLGAVNVTTIQPAYVCLCSLRVRQYVGVLTPDPLPTILITHMHIASFNLRRLPAHNSSNAQIRDYRRALNARICIYHVAHAVQRAVLRRR